MSTTCAKDKKSISTAASSVVAARRIVGSAASALAKSDGAASKAEGQPTKFEVPKHAMPSERVLRALDMESSNLVEQPPPPPLKADPPHSVSQHAVELV